MLPVVALVGRPNVGKSSLFNALLGRGEALVSERPGATRDRHHAVLRREGTGLILVDTGGLGGGEDPLAPAIARQVERAIAEADLVLLVLDAREGLLPQDREILDRLRALGRPAWAIANKAETLSAEAELGEFAPLGLARLHAVSATHRRGIAELEEELFLHFGARAALPAEHSERPRIAIVGRPNVGKSTLANRLLGEERLVVSELPGTTRDAIEVPFERDGRGYLLIDTAGIRRRARVVEAIERASVVRSLQAIESCDVAIAVLDAQAGIAEQDLAVIGQVLEAGRALVIAVNKWDGLDADRRERQVAEIDRRLRFAGFARRVFISARHGSGLGELWAAVDRAYDSAVRDLPTAELNRILAAAVAAHQPPLVGGRVPRLRYAHQGGRRPPRVVIHGSRLGHLAAAYRRYLENVFRERLGLEGTPLRLQFLEGRDPGRRPRRAGGWRAAARASDA
ncbi:MAG: ribosome biogenesis GTPase Der [Xanthomonadales bacterium]|nr:ribosome biogenesis GTPase Der [Xanthomonadales bacterium]